MFAYFETCIYHSISWAVERRERRVALVVLAVDVLPPCCPLAGSALDSPQDWLVLVQAASPLSTLQLLHVITFPGYLLNS